MRFRVFQRNSYGKDRLQRIAIRNLEQFTAVRVGRLSILCLPEPPLDPAASKPKTGSHQMHIAHDNGTIFRPHIRFRHIRKDQNCTPCLFQHFRGACPAMGKFFQHLPILYDHKFPGFPISPGCRRKPRLQNFLQIFSEIRSPVYFLILLRFSKSSIKSIIIASFSFSLLYE